MSRDLADLAMCDDVLYLVSKLLWNLGLLKPRKSEVWVHQRSTAAHYIDVNVLTWEALDQERVAPFIKLNQSGRAG